MINKLRRKFTIVAISCVFLFLTAILLVVNVVNFSLVGNDADIITERIMLNGGRLNNMPEPEPNPGESEQALIQYAPGQNPMGPESPELKDSLRYFTIKFDKNNEATVVDFKINAFTEEEATNIARGLTRKSTGWVQKIYRYRVYQLNEKNVVYVTLIDQGRELKPCFNVLYTSLIGEGIGLVFTTVAVILISRWLVEPIVYSDNKQKRFIANASNALRTPASIISLDNATLINENGEKEANKSIRYQLKTIIDLANDLNAFSLIAESKGEFEELNLSNICKETIKKYESGFESSKKELRVNIEDNVLLNGDLGMIQKMLAEVMENTLKFSETFAEINIKKDKERVVLEFINDAKGIPNGTLDRVFDRFYRLDYKDHSKYEGNGIGLSIAKDIVDKHKGRIIAKGENDNFILKIEF